MELTHEVLFQLALSYHRMNFKGRRVIHYPSELFSRHLFSHNCWPLFYPYNLNVFLRSINIIYIYICFFTVYIQILFKSVTHHHIAKTEHPNLWVHHRRWKSPSRVSLGSRPAAEGTWKVIFLPAPAAGADVGRVLSGCWHGFVIVCSLSVVG